MSRNDTERPMWPEGRLGSIPPRTLSAILKTRDFNDRRDRDLRTLLGSYQSRDPTIDAIVTECTISFARGEYRRIGDYQRLLKPVASAFAVRAQILRLASAGVLVVRHDPDNPRFTIVAPTAKLCGWAVLVAPRWADEAARLFGHKE